MLDVSEAFVALPDNEFGVRHAESVGLEVLAAYPNGRPMIVGRAKPERYCLFQTKDCTLLALGTLPKTIESDLGDQAKGLSDVCDVNSLRVAGSFFLIVRLGNGLRIQGSLSGLRRVFWASTGEESIAGSDASLVARLIQAPVDAKALVRWTVTPHMPYPLAESTPYVGVHALRSGCFLRSSNGTAIVERYWPPRIRNQFASKADAIALLRERVDEAVAVRCDQPMTVSCDASGGIDSTVILALAVRHRKSLSAFTTGPPHLFDQERQRAEQVVRLLGVGRWVTTLQDEFPSVFSEVDRCDISSDLPFGGDSVKARSSFIAGQITKHNSSSGPVAHLTGHLGDELFASGIAHLRDIRSTNPRVAILHLRALHSRTRIPKAVLLRWMMGGSSYKNEILRFSRTGKMALGWHSSELLVPPWISPTALGGLSPGSYEKANVEPLGYGAEQHEVLSRVRASCELLRQESKIMAANGVYLEIPFGDDRVLDAILNLPAGSLQDPLAMKPVLRQSFGDLIPAPVLDTTTKLDNTAAIWEGLSVNFTALDRITREMRAHDIGIVNARQFRDVLFGPHLPSLAPLALWRTLGVERWLTDRDS